MINNLFSIPIWKNSLNISNDIKKNLLNQITQNHKQHKNYIHPDWNCTVHSTHKENNNIDYYDIIPFYKQEYENFVSKNNLDVNFHNYILNNPWYNYYQKYSNQELHDHIQFDSNKMFQLFSGIHYLKLNQDHPKITFYNPSLAHIMYEGTNFFNDDNLNHSFFKKYFVLDVKEGDLIIFPSCLGHAVFQQTVDDPRITIAFNIQSEWRQIK